MQNPKPTQKDLFLKALCERDINTLYQILDDDITYFGASKTIFLERLAYIFDQLRLAGQKGDLVIKKRKNKEDTYYLHSETTVFSYKFIIEEYNGTLLRVYNNKKVKSIAASEIISKHDLYFGVDERVEFEPTQEYLATIKECKEAIDELEFSTLNTITTDELDNWLGKNLLLFVKVYPQYQYFKFNDFKGLYTDLNWYLGTLLKVDQVKEALNAFANCPVDEIDDWCEYYNRLYFCETMGFCFDYSLIDIKGAKIRYSPDSNIYFKGDDFFSIIRFNVIFTMCFDTRGEKSTWW